MRAVVLPAVAFVVAGLVAPVAFSGRAREAPAVPIGEFSDDFETDRGWVAFEEIVGGSDCYKTGLGEVVRSPDVAASGSQGLRVWSNKNLALFANHIFGRNRVATSGRQGAWHFSAYTFIAAETAATGEVGPELSMQNTRLVNGQFLTSTAGIQYRANPDDLVKRFTLAVWAETTPGQADWQTFHTLPAALPAGAWLRFEVGADFTTARYRGFRLSGPGVSVMQDLSAFRMAAEQKPGFDSESFELTLESQSRWNNCPDATQAFDYKLYYDDVQLISVSFDDEPLRTGDTIRERHITELRTRVNELRTTHHLAPYPWTDDPIVPAVTAVSAVHVADLRAALNEVFERANRTPPAYTDPLLAGITVKVAHITELRAAVVTLE